MPTARPGAPGTPLAIPPAGGKLYETILFSRRAGRGGGAAAGDVARGLKELGGARLILCTAPSGKAITEAFAGLAPGGQAVVVSAPSDPIVIPPGLLLAGRSIKGLVEGSIEEAIRFSLLAGVHPVSEVFPLEEAPAAFEKMMSSKVHSRSVLKMG